MIKPKSLIFCFMKQNNNNWQKNIEEDWTKNWKKYKKS